MGSYASSGQQYATTSDLAAVIAAAALAHPSTGVAAQNAALLKASEDVDMGLRDQFTMPLLTWGSDIVQVVCDIAAYRLVCLRGFNPEKDGHFQDNWKSAEGKIKLWAQGILVPDVKDSSPGAAPGVPSIDAQPTAVTASPINSTGGTTRGTGSR